MSVKEKASPAGSTAKAGRTETAAFGGAATSCNYPIIDNENGQVHWLADLIPHGRQHAITGKRLAEITGTRELRNISKTVELIRRSGTPVCAATGENPGYFLPETTKELLSYLKSFDRRLREMRKTRDAMEAAFISMQGQCVIGGWTDEK